MGQCVPDVADRLRCPGIVWWVFRYQPDDLEVSLIFVRFFMLRLAVLAERDVVAGLGFNYSW